jgi:hypothetical protein
LMDDSMAWSQAPKPASPIKDIAQPWSEPAPVSPVKSQPAPVDFMSSQVPVAAPKEPTAPVVESQPPVVPSLPISMKTLLYSSEAQGLKVEVLYILFENI